MRKYLYAFVGCCLIQSVFAEQPSGVYQNQHVSSILIPRIILQNVLTQDDLISQTPGAVEKMMAKYDKLAGPLGQEPLTVNDITQICVESDVITKKEDCLNRVFNPVLAEMGKVRFINTCSGKITGGNNHCIDDVFVEGKKQNGNQYHQDVNVNPYAANGFAIEYAKKKGHDVWCSSEVKDSTVLCTTLDNKEFYSVKFKGTNNTTDSTIEKNLVKGICALFDSKYAIGTFRHQCKMDCGPGTKAREVIQKFGLTVHDGYSTDTHCAIYQPTYTAKDVKTYPGYEYMSRAFKSIQSVLDSSLVNVLETYVKLQGIDFRSFNCEFSPRKYNDEMSEGGIPVSFDDMLRCRINDTEVDFIFDDLFEGKEYERKAGQAAMQCIAFGGNYGSDKTCRNLTIEQCNEANTVVPGGTRWDNKAGVCLLNNVEKARNMSNTLQISGGVILAIGATIATGGTAMLVLLEVVSGALVDMASIGLERLEILKPFQRAYEFATDAQKCEIPTKELPQCSEKQSNCAYNVFNKHFARLNEILDDLNPEQSALVDDLWDKTKNCLTPELFLTAIGNSTITTTDKFINTANVFLLVGSILVTPEKVLTKLGKLPKLTKFLTKRGLKLLSSTSDALKTGAKYKRIDIDKFDNADDLNKFTHGLQNNGYFYKIDTDTRTGKKYLMVADKDIFNSVTMFEIKNITMVKDNGAVSVFKFIDTNSNKTYYFKHTDEFKEITRTKRAYEILNNKSDIVHTVKIIEDDQANLRSLAKQHNIENSSGKYWFVMEETSGSLTASNIVYDTTDPLRTVFRGKPITLAEQDEILRAIDNLNSGGIIHGDLHSNMFFIREPNGKLRVDIIDYEPWSANPSNKNTDKEAVQKMFEWFAGKGLAETKNTVLRIDMLKGKLSNQFDELVIKFSQTGQLTIFPANKLTDVEWNEINNYLEQYDIELIDYVAEDGKKYKKFFFRENALNNSTTFSKVYGKLSNEEVERRLQWVLNNSNNDFEIVDNAIKANVYNSDLGRQFGQDLGYETVGKLYSYPDLVERLRSWREIDLIQNTEERERVIEELHNIITRERRTPLGNTEISFDPGSADGGHMAPDANNPFRKFEYNARPNNIRVIINEVFHENVHAFQSVGKSTIPEPFYKISHEHYISPYRNKEYYNKQIIEQEAYEVADIATDIVMRTFNIME